jgi:hypothetical protein
MVFSWGFLKEKKLKKKKKKGDPTHGVIIHGSDSGKSSCIRGTYF